MWWSEHAIFKVGSLEMNVTWHGNDTIGSADCVIQWPGADYRFWSTLKYGGQERARRESAREAARAANLTPKQYAAIRTYLFLRESGMTDRTDDEPHTMESMAPCLDVLFGRGPHHDA